MSPRPIAWRHEICQKEKGEIIQGVCNLKPKQLFSILLLLLFLIIVGCGGGSGDSGETVGSPGSSGSLGSSGGTINLAWDADTEPDLAGYKLHYGTVPGVYDHSVDVHNVTTYTLLSLTKGQTYYIVATAYDTSHNESGYSNGVSGTAR
jgi:hypothetical protein